MSRFIITEVETTYRDVRYDRERIVGLLTRDDWEDEGAPSSEQLAAMTDQQLAEALKAALNEYGTVQEHISEVVTETGGGDHEYEIEIQA